jgi:hypothetical protein
MNFKYLGILTCWFLSCSSSKSDDQITLNSPDTTALVKLNNEKNDFIVDRWRSNRFEIAMCKNLDHMSQPLFELKYPFENFSSTHAYSNEDGTVTLLISPREEKADQKDLPNYQQTFTSNFANNPSIDFKRCEIKKIDSRDFIIVEMITPAVDSQIYNLMYVTSVEGKLLVCTFNCTLDKLAEWQPIGEKMLNSITINNL